MDSLLANYASSDEEEQEDDHSISSTKIAQEDPLKPNASLKSSGFFSSLPPPKSSFSLPPPKSDHHLPNPLNPQFTRQRDENRQELDIGVGDEEPKSAPSGKPSSTSSIFSVLPQPKSTSSASSLFSSMPPPKTQKPDPPEALPNPLASSDSAPKRVVQFRPPINPVLTNPRNDDDDDDDEKERQKRKLKAAESTAQPSSVKSFLSSIPAPKNSSTLGGGALGLGTSGRRSILQTDVPAADGNVATGGGVNLDTEGYYEGQPVGGLATGGNELGGTGEYAVSGDNEYSAYGHGSVSDFANVDYSSWAGEANGDYANYSGGSGYGNYGYYESNNWEDGSSGAVPPEVPMPAERSLRLGGKRGRDIPPEIVEVKQDELIKNRPREDQVKLTGIAFGPSYQPTSTKGKPSKLHKRKHQIGSLYFDMKQKEMELAERRAKGFLTKAETHAKYGW